MTDFSFQRRKNKNSSSSRGQTHLFIDSQAEYFEFVRGHPLEKKGTKGNVKKRKKLPTQTCRSCVLKARNSPFPHVHLQTYHNTGSDSRPDWTGASTKARSLVESNSHIKRRRRCEEVLLSLWTFCVKYSSQQRDLSAPYSHLGRPT